MTLAEPFAVGTSLLHRRDPRAKLLAALAWSIALALLQNLHVLAAGLGCSIVLLAMARLSPGLLFRRLMIVNLFILCAWLVLPWTVPGKSITAFGPVTITQPGVLLALRMTIRCNAIVFVCIALLGTSPLLATSQSLRSLHVPEKIVLILFFCVQYIQVIHDEYTRMTAAIRLRGFRQRTTLHAYRTYANLVGLLLVRSHDRAIRVYDAMLCRGFDGRLRSLYENHLTWRDWVLTGGIVTITMVLVIWECTTIH